MYALFELCFLTNTVVDRLVHTPSANSRLNPAPSVLQGRLQGTVLETVEFSLKGQGSGRQEPGDGIKASSGDVWVL
jgi:hypothetical protein